MLYILVGCEGARKRSKTRLRSEAPRSKSRRPKCYKNRGFLTSQKLSKSFFVCPSGGPLMTKNCGKRSFFDRPGAPSQLFVLSFFLGFGEPAAGRELRTRFVSAGFASGGVFGQPCLVPKKGPQKFVVKKNGVFSLFDSCFGPFLAHHFLGWVVLRCGAHFWAPITRGSDLLERYQNGRFGVLRCVLAAVPCILRRKFPHSSRGRTRKCRYMWQGFTSSTTNPL